MARKLSPGVHTIRIKKPGGGTRMQRVQVLKSGKFKFIKNVKGGAKATPRPSAKAKPRGKKARTSPGRRTNKMAKRKSSLPNRLINAALLLLTFARPIEILVGGGSIQAKANLILNDATGGISSGRKFDLPTALRLYGPVAAGFILFEVKKMAMKKFRF